MEQTAARLMSILCNELFATPLDRQLFDGMSEPEWQDLLQLAKHHDLAHLLGDALSREEICPFAEVKNKLEEVFCEAYLRAQLMEGELQRLEKLFCEAQIPYLPLKGAVIRRLYPEPWMRTSCDIDILIHKQDVKKTKDLLLRKCGYRFVKQPVFHEISFYSPTGVHLELHFSIEENDPQLDVVLRRSWDYAVPTGENPYAYRFQDVFLQFHSLAHAAYHFKGGGCGIRPLIDQFLLERRTNADAEELQALLAEAKLTVFAEQFCKLCRVWFADGERDELVDRMEQFILSGGVYGSLKSRQTVRLIQHGRFGNFMRRIWLPYRSMIVKYPSIEGKRILLPLYEIRRWLTLFKGRVFKRVAGEIKTTREVDDARQDRVKALLDDWQIL